MITQPILDAADPDFRVELHRVIRITERIKQYCAVPEGRLVTDLVDRVWPVFGTDPFFTELAIWEMVEDGDLRELPGDDPPRLMTTNPDYYRRGKIVSEVITDFETGVTTEIKDGFYRRGGVLLCVSVR